MYLGGGHKFTPKMCIKLREDSATWIPLHCECEEAVDRIMKHIENSVLTDTVERVMIASADADVMISALYHFKRTFQKIVLRELWTIKDTRLSVRCILLHTIHKTENMDNLLVSILPAVHSLTGCDTTSKIGTNLWYLKLLFPQGNFCKILGLLLLMKR